MKIRRRPDDQQLDDVAVEEALLDQLEPGVGQVALGVAVEGGAVGEPHPRRPQMHDEAPYRILGIGVFEDADLAARLEHAPRLGERRELEFGRQHAEQERGGDGVERGVGETEGADVHGGQGDVGPGRAPALRRPPQHGGADVDADDARPGGIERHVAPGADAGVEHAPREPREQMPAQLLVAAVLERQVEQVV